VQIVKTTHQIRGLAADLITFHRESWKADLRRKVLLNVPLASAEVHDRKEEALRAIRKGFAQAMAGKPWYHALTEEVLEEELAEDGTAKRERVLTSLAIAEQTQTAEAVDGRTILLEATRLLCRPHEELATALAILEENERLLLEGRSTGGWLKRLLGRGGGTQRESHTYKVEYTEPGAPTSKTEVLDFTKVRDEVRKKSSLFAALSSGTGPAYRKLTGTAEPQLASFLDRQLNELLLIHRRLTSLNTLFQARVTQEKKTARGIKIELLTLKNAIVKANQRRHEYKDSGTG
jgi:hypothetical protein